MDERIRFTGRLLEVEKIPPLCRAFGISRVTGYKIFNRYEDNGLDGLNDRSRAPYGGGSCSFHNNAADSVCETRHRMRGASYVP